MTVRKLPALLDTAFVAEALDWPTWKARRWLVKSGAGRLIGGRYYTTVSKLSQHFPETLARVLGGEDE